MEHIVQFAISMDDEAIKKSVAINAEKAIIADLNKQVSEVLFEYSRWGNKGAISRWTEARFDEFLEEHKDEIIAAAVENLASRLVRTKAAKEALAKKLEGGDEDVNL